MIARIHPEYAHVPRRLGREAASAVTGGSTSDATIPQARFVARRVGETRSLLRYQCHRPRATVPEYRVEQRVTMLGVRLGAVGGRESPPFSTLARTRRRSTA